MQKDLYCVNDFCHALSICGNSQLIFTFLILEGLSGFVVETVEGIYKTGIPSLPSVHWI
jgi:hypothetical protein